MRRELIIDESPGYIRAAILEDGRLCEILSEKQTESDQTESLFYGRVQSVQKSVGAAFVDIGEELNAFLPLEEGMKLRCGEMIILQGTAKQATETKGLRVTARINLAGKWLVLIPGGCGVHISKKVKDPALREALKEIGLKICPDEFGMIIRTASGGVNRELLEEEVSVLQRRWHEILLKASGMIRPGLLHRCEKLDIRLVRDLHDLTRIVTNSSSGYSALLEAEHANRLNAGAEICLFEECEQLIFDAYGIEPQIDKALKSRAWLPCGGYLVIDPCEAMTVIDVNSGRMILGHDIDDMALRVNLEAADEAARQIRLRDISGIIIIDFIDMKDETARQKLIERMKLAVKSDRAQVKVEGLTRLGLMEITRKRVHSPLSKILRSGCSYCSGSGSVISADETARRAIRQVRRMQISGQRGPFLIQCAPASAQLLEGMTCPVSGGSVYVQAVAGKHAERFEIKQLGDGVPPPKGAASLNVRMD